MLTKVVTHPSHSCCSSWVKQDFQSIYRLFGILDHQLYWSMTYHSLTNSTLTNAPTLFNLLNSLNKRKKKKIWLDIFILYSTKLVIKLMHSFVAWQSNKKRTTHFSAYMAYIFLKIFGNFSMFFSGFTFSINF